MSILFKLRESRVGEVGYKVFQLCMPPIRVSRSVWGLNVFFNLRDCLFYLAMSRQELETLEGSVFEVLKATQGPVWDVGCNVGLFSIYCASQGREVTAFDISDKCIQLLEASATYNKLNVRTVPTALSIEPFEFNAPKTAHTMNGVVMGGDGAKKKSITVVDAEKEFGIPRLIKMDIEGAEIEFFRSTEFKSWIQVNRISLLVEIHSDKIWNEIWTDMEFKKIDSRHVLYFFDSKGFV